MSITTENLFTVTVNATHRNSICRECNTKMEVKDVAINNRLVKRPVCQTCGGMLGQIIGVYTGKGIGG